MNISDCSSPLIIGHRGYRKKYPENTLKSFKAAFDAGVQMIEADVSLTKDREVVVIHDDTLERTTNGRGLVKDHLLKELKQLDAGSWFDPAFEGETIPTLEEVLDVVSKRGMINIEIKKNAYEKHQPVDAIERQVVRIVQQNKMKDQVLISSFKHEILENLVQISDKPAIALLSKNPASRETIILCQKLRVFSWHPSFSKIDKRQVRMMHEAGIKVFPYTVNSGKKLNQLIKMGVDGVFTDDPYIEVQGG